MKKTTYYTISIAILLLTRLLFLLYEHACFSSDNALFGIMAMDISRLEQFPVFTYGEKYALAISSYLAAPLFALFSPSVFLLKLPVFLINIAVLALMTNILIEENGLRYFDAFVSTSFFTACGIALASRLTNLEAGIEAFMMIFLCWTFRKKPFLFGLLAAMGFHIRAFTIFGTIWVMFFAALEKRMNFRYLMCFSATFFLVFYGIFIAGAHSPNYNGSETSTFLDVTSPKKIFPVFTFLFGNILPAMFGARCFPLSDLGIPGESMINASANWMVISVSLAIVAAVTVPALFRALLKRDINPSDHFPLFLILTGFSSCAAYIVFRGGGSLNLMHMRYVYFALLIPIGLTAFALKNRLRGHVRILFVTAVLAMGTVNAAGGVSLWREYIFHTPPDKFRDLADYLEEKKINYAAAEYWTAYHVTFLTAGRVIVNPNSNVRVEAYNRKYMDNGYYAYRIGPYECPGGEKVHEWYICPRAEGVPLPGANRQPGNKD